MLCNIVILTHLIFSMAQSSLGGIAYAGYKEYEGVNVEYQYQKDRSFEALDATFHSICDGILTSSSKMTKLSVKQDKLLTNFIRQNAIFEVPGFDKNWLEKIKLNLDKLNKEEGNTIALVLKHKMEHLYAESLKKK